ncbi:hypothetical protein [Paenibacillus monticola]|uniref:Uncharacterized protein n=1 Tax=Paenibacillus monticola TaxID=2666075 RepID=A0A7X2L0G5_9BACL|nr:hypothetical protein [Paenibacillus monticola]MRN52075.1 hypothetical protein [Paenibacillus monticola]
MNLGLHGNPISDQYLPKINVTLASGDLPDVTPVNATQLKQMVDSDQIEDMTELFCTAASSRLRLPEIMQKRNRSFGDGKRGFHYIQRAISF